MGVFLIGSLIWMVAILIDKNRVFPKWFGYLNLCNALTEVVVAPCLDLPARRLRLERRDRLVDRHGGVRRLHGRRSSSCCGRMILREDFGTGPLPDLPARTRRRG